MKLYSWNVNGIRAAERKGFLDWLDQTQPDILCLQETKARVDQLGSSLIEDHGYHTYWHSADKAGDSGVATFCKEEPYFVQEGLGIDRFDSEGRVLITEHENFLLYNIYYLKVSQTVPKVFFLYNSYYLVYLNKHNLN